ncbi:ATPase [Photobacterium aquae]|uniref:histidine kinase n=1 Tax=Photobacterium aquae TaxID=1195763 RepID=A0A0J1GXP2_9GAMM|nr:ATP-binding protein [Photobacterium aquae]KLV04194.1 ATPase [Photobacterium aquae]
MDNRQIELLQKKISRERNARRNAEKLLEAKSLELFEANKVIEKSLEKVKAKAENDSELLTYQAKVDNLLLEFGRRFIKHSPNNQLIEELTNALVDSRFVRACSIRLECPSVASLNVCHTSGRQQIWQSPPNLKNLGEIWDENEKILWLSLDKNDIVHGYLATRIKASGTWLETIRKQMLLFSDMIRSSIDRQLKLEEAITAREQAEASEKSTRDFLAMINHELRTPLNGLLGTAELMADTNLNSHQQRLLSTLNHSGELLRSIINDLLDYSKINAGMLELTNKPFDSHTMMMMLHDIFQHRANEKQLELNMDITKETPRWIIGDEDRIKQIFVNLISNAIKFTERGAISIKIRWQDNQLCFIVSDTGCGIPEDKIVSLFEPFTQVDNSSQRNHEGTGLGLAICKRLTEQMGGNISVESKMGIGSTFSVSIPLAKHVHEAKVNDKEALTALPIDKLNILVVEDLKTNQMIINLMLSKFGIKPTIANHGQEALSYIEHQTFDIILMDCRMPIMDGYTATERLRKSGYNKPIIALTAGTTRVERDDCFAAGMNDILCKPYQTKELRELLEKWSKD